MWTTLFCKGGCSGLWSHLKRLFMFFTWETHRLKNRSDPKGKNQNKGFPILFRGYIVILPLACFLFLAPKMMRSWLHGGADSTERKKEKTQRKPAQSLLGHSSEKWEIGVVHSNWREPKTKISHFLGQCS